MNGKKSRLIALVTVLALLAAVLCGCGDKEEKGIAGTWVLDTAATEEVNTKDLTGDALNAVRGSIRKQYADVSQTLTLKQDGTCTLVSSAYGRALTQSGTYGFGGKELTLVRRVQDGTLNMTDFSDTECVVLPDENGTFMMTDSRNTFTGSCQIIGGDGGDMTAPIKLTKNKAGTGGTFTQGDRRGTFTLSSGNLSLCFENGTHAAPYTLRLDSDENGEGGRIFVMDLDGSFTMEGEDREGTWETVQDGWRFTFTPLQGPDLTVTLSADGTFTALRRAGTETAGTYVLKNGVLTLSTAGGGSADDVTAFLPSVTMDPEGTFSCEEGTGRWERDGLVYTFTYDNVPLTVNVRESGSYTDSAGAAGTWTFDDLTVTLMTRDVICTGVHGCSLEGDTLKIWTLPADEDGGSAKNAAGNGYIQVYRRK